MLIGVERMLRIHFLQHWFNLSDRAVAEALYDSRAMRRLVGIDLGPEPVPDETTICKFRHGSVKDLSAISVGGSLGQLQKHKFLSGNATIQWYTFNTSVYVIHITNLATKELCWERS